MKNTLKNGTIGRARGERKWVHRKRGTEHGLCAAAFKCAASACSGASGALLTRRLAVLLVQSVQFQLLAAVTALDAIGVVNATEQLDVLGRRHDRLGAAMAPLAILATAALAH